MPSSASCEVGSVSLGFRGAVDKSQDCKGCRGFRNTFDLGMFAPDGTKYRPEDACAQPAPIESKLIAQWGPFIVKVSGDHISGWHPVEIQSSNAWIAHESTNSAPDSEWDGPHYLPAGARTYCVTLAHIDHWVCQSGTMSPAGRLENFGSNQRSFTLAKTDRRAPR